MDLTIEDKNSSPTSVLYDANMKTMGGSLPQDVILFQIITRVATKSVVRFKCVSNQWNSILMSDRFKQMHSHNLLKEPHLEEQNLFFYFREAATFYTIDCESPPDNAPCSRPLPSFEAGLPRYKHILTSSHGLVCVGIMPEYTYNDDPLYSDIILWNPLTTEYKRLSKPSNPDHMDCYTPYGKGHGLYYSSCEDDYKLLVVTEDDNVYIYSLKYDLWRKLDKKPPFQNYWRVGFCFNENLYFLFDYNGQTSIRFDTTAERFHKIETPSLPDNIYKPYSSAITVNKGSIHFCVVYDIQPYGFLKGTCLKLWKYNADADIWSKVVTYQLKPYYDIHWLSPLHLMSNGNWLMRNDKDGGCICQVDLKKKEYTKDKDGHKRKGKNKSKGNDHDEYKLLYYSDFRLGRHEEIIYIETFVSPNQYMK